LSNLRGAEYTELQGEPIGGDNEQELQDELANFRVGPLNGQIYTELEEEELEDEE
jgi:hypothetical protein